MSLTQPAHAGRTDLDRNVVRLALLGCGTVGSGVASLLLEPSSGIAARSGVEFRLDAIAVRSLEKARDESIPRELFTTDALALVTSNEIDVVIECIGGTGIAAELVEAALARGKHVVTANKDLLATRGPELRALAHDRAATIAYEAAVGGAIPIVRSLAESLAGEEIIEVGGVLNGTTNFILSAMFAGSSYASALAEAQRLGFAEADPTNDVEGIDAAHKLAILVQLAFRRALHTRQIPRTGIARLSRDDLSLAKRLGMTVKLLACARAGASLVTPAYVRAEHPFAQGAGAQNCIRVTGRSSGSLTFAGSGAGSAPTASAVIGDIVAVLRRISAGRRLGAAALDADLTPVDAALEATIPLRRIVRLVSLRDARPARDALHDAGLAATQLEGVPAILTDVLDGDASALLESVLAGRGLQHESVLPLWEDAAVVPLDPSDSNPQRSVISTPA